MRHYFFIFVFFVAMVQIAVSQKNEATIRKKIENEKNDSLKVNSLMELSTFFLGNNPDSSLRYANSALALSEKINYAKGLCASHQRIGAINQNTGKFSEANQHFFKALKYAEKYNLDKYQIQIFNSIANACAYQKMFDQAIMYYQRALNIIDSSKTDYKKATIFMNMGNIAYSKGYDKKDFKQAYIYLDQALQIAETTHDSTVLPSIYGNYALYKTDEEKYEDAVKYINKGIELNQKTGDLDNKIFLYYYAGRAYSHMKQFKKALEHFNESVKYAQQLKDRDYLSENYLCLAEMYADMNNFKMAYDYLWMYKLTEDTLLNHETTKELNELKTIYETEKKEQEIELSHQKLQTQESKLKNQQTIIVSSVGGAILLLIVVFVLYSRYQLKQKANKKLGTAYAIIEEKNKDITDSINYAQKIQHAILPDTKDIQQAFPNSFIFFKPRDIVSGDFYWFHQITTSSDDYSFIAAADCTGHGVPGAMMSMIGSSLLNQIVLENKVNSAGEVLDLLQSGIKTAFKQKAGENKRRDGMDIGLLLFSKQRNTVQFSGANNGLYHISNGFLNEIKPTKQAIGENEGEEINFKTVEIQVAKGDCLYLYTDGYADQFGGENIPGKQAAGKKFKYSRLKELLLSIHTLSMEEQKTKIEETFTIWKGLNEQVDDVLIIGIKV